MNKYEILYKRGLISYEEYQEKSLQLALYVQFEDKLNKELKQFKKNLKKKSKNEIMDTAYELTCKEEIKQELLNLDDNKKEFLYLQNENILNEFYSNWLKYDSPLSDSIRDSIDETINRKMKIDINER
jgi:hypothetical protein